MSSPTTEQSIVYQVSMYSSLVDGETGPDLEATLSIKIQAELNAAATRAKIGDWSVAWGPVVKQFDTTSYAVNAMYVAERNDGGTRRTYVVGIAGTNPTSLFDWLVEDALVSKQIPWPYALVSAPGAKIAVGTGIGLAILQKATPASGTGAGTTLREFLAGIEHKEDATVVVSGHSLGGALSPTVALWLEDTRLLWDPFHHVTLSTMPTAGPTAGNGDFAAYSDGKLAITRFANDIDVVPHAWQASDLTKIPTLYAPHIEPDATITALVAAAEKISSGGDYTQLVHDTGWFTGTFQPYVYMPPAPPPPATLYFFWELAYQHTTAYQTFFGVQSPALERWAEQYQAAAVAAAPAVAAGLVAAAAARATTAPVEDQPQVIPHASDPASDAVAARVLADLVRQGTPDQQRITTPVDPRSLAPAPAGSGTS